MAFECICVCGYLFVSYNRELTLFCTENSYLKGLGLPYMAESLLAWVENKPIITTGQLFITVTKISDKRRKSLLGSWFQRSQCTDGQLHCSGPRVRRHIMVEGCGGGAGLHSSQPEAERKRWEPPQGQ